MKRIITIALIAGALLQTGIVKLPHDLSACLSPADSVAEAGNQVERSEQTGGDIAGETRFPLQKPQGAFLQKVFEVFEL